MDMTKYNLNIRGTVREFDGPQVMGIVNVTPDSFWEGSRLGVDEDRIRARALQILSEGGTMIDVGAYSTRPGAPDVAPTVELDRLALSLRIIREEVGREVPISVDTFRAEVAETCIRELDADIINDISGGTLDAGMIPVVVSTGAPYILMHMRGTPQDMQQHTDYPEGVVKAVETFFAAQIGKIEAEAENQGKTEQMAASRSQIILDPGYGFAKTLEQNYELMRGLPQLMASYTGYPVLVGISRKSMIYRLLGTDPSQALNGTTVLNAFALQCGAHILRVHDVREAVETVRITQMLRC